MKIYKKIIAISFFSLFSINISYAVDPIGGGGTPVFDSTSYLTAVQQLESMKQMIEHNAEMAKQVGDGKLTPQTINWASDWYTKCGGGKFTLPDWFPHPKLNICADGNKQVELGVDWYERELLIDAKLDTPEQAKIKSQKQQKALKQVRAYSLSKSVLEMQRGEEDPKSIEEFQNGLKGSKDQIAIQKIQTQVMIQTLAELQKLNIKQAEIIHIMSLKE